MRLGCAEKPRPPRAQARRSSQIALVGMATGFVEATLAQLFKIRDDKGQFRGGPAYYMEKGLGARWMGILFSIFLIIAFGFVFNSVQANTITGAMQGAFGVPTWISGIAVVILTALIIFGGLRSIARFSELAVPFMAVAYLLLAVGIILFNLSELPGVLAMVVKSAFGWHEAAAGGIGAAILNGFKRGLFSNEAGMGSAPNAAASATPYPPHPASQGYVQMAGVFIDTLLICTASAAIILLAGPQEGEGIMLVQNALTSQVGDWGRYFLAVIILFFAFTSIVANYFYAENCLVFLEHNHLAGLLIFRLIVLAMVMFGALASLPFVWNLADVSMGLMAITNLIAILLLSNLAIKLAKDYNAQRKAGKLPTFDASQFPEVQQKLEPGIAHIQNTAPGPPSVIATATPATLPVPTRAAREVQSAWNEEIPESSDWRLPLSTLKVWPKWRNWINPRRTVKYRPQPTSSQMRILPQIRPLSRSTT